MTINTRIMKKAFFVVLLLSLFGCSKPSGEEAAVPRNATTTPQLAARVVQLIKAASSISAFPVAERYVPGGRTVWGGTSHGDLTKEERAYLSNLLGDPRTYSTIANAGAPIEKLFQITITGTDNITLLFANRNGVDVTIHKGEIKPGPLRRSGTLTLSEVGVVQLQNWIADLNKRQTDVKLPSGSEITIQLVAVGTAEGSGERRLVVRYKTPITSEDIHDHVMQMKEIVGVFQAQAEADGAAAIALTPVSSLLGSHPVTNMTWIFRKGSSGEWLPAWNNRL